MRADFTKRKFLTFSLPQQHRKCTELLRYVYETLMKGQIDKEQLKAYCEMVEWLKMDPLATIEPKALADRYHEHLRHSQMKHKEHNLLPAVRRGDRALAETPWPISIYFDRIRSAHNIGSMLRTIEAFALGNAFFSEGMPFATDKQVLDAAMGACQWVECRQGVALETLPRPLIIMETSPEAVSIFDVEFPEEFTLVVGNEEYGCSDHTLRSADMLVEIPLRGHKNSLNVANAFAIAAAEIYRQKNDKSKKTTL